MGVYFPATYEALAVQAVERHNFIAIRGDNSDRTMYYYDGRTYSNDTAAMLDIVSQQEAIMYREAKQGKGTTLEHYNIVEVTEAYTKKGDPKGKLVQSPALQRQVMAGQNRPIEIEPTSQTIRRILETAKGKSPIRQIGQGTERKLCMSDCVIEISKTGVKVLEHSPDMIFTSYLDINYNMNRAEFEPLIKEFKTFILQWANGNKKQAAVLTQIMGTVLRNETGAGRMFFLVNEHNDETGAGNGKTTYLNAIKGMLGETKFSTLTLEQVAKGNHELAAIVGKATNISDDESRTFIDKTGLIKSIVSGTTISINPKGEPTYTAMITATLMLACNKLPKINDTTQGMKDRVIAVPFGARFRNTDKEISLETMTAKFSTPQGRRALLEIAIGGLLEILKNGYVLDTKTQDFTARYFKDNSRDVDNVLTYIEDMQFENGAEYFIGKATEAEYQKYHKWALDNGRKPVGSNEFIPSVCERTGLIKGRGYITVNVWNNYKQEPTRKQVTMFKEAGRNDTD